MSHISFVCMDLKADSAEQAIHALCVKLVESGAVDPRYEAEVLKREGEYPTGLPTAGYPLAMPHAANTYVKHSAIAVGRLESPVSFASMAMDGEMLAVRLVFLLAIKDPNQQLDLLQNLVMVIQQETLLREMEKADSSEALACLLRETGVA